MCIGLFDIAINCGIMRPYIIIMCFKKLPLILSTLLVTNLIFVMTDLVHTLHTVVVVVKLYAILCTVTKVLATKSFFARKVAYNMQSSL